MPDAIKVGLIGLDNSHVLAFTKLLNDPADPHHLAGARVAAGFGGLPSDFHWSHTRVDKFTQQLRDMGVPMVESAEEVARQADLVLITAVDGRQHRTLLERILPMRKPVFIDKPLATSLADARWMIDAAGKAGVAMMCSSALRYADNFAAAIAAGPVECIDVYGPVAEEPAMPGLFWYGVHCVEMAVAALGAGCQSVHRLSSEHAEMVCLRWKDGRTAMLHGLRARPHGSFGAVLHRPKGAQFVDINDNQRPYYAGLMEAILQLPAGRQPVPPEQMLEVVAIMEAANRSLAEGKEVTL